MTGKTYVLLGLFASMCLGVGSARANDAIGHADGADTPARQWDMISLRFTADDLPDQPLDVSLTVTFDGPDGESLAVPGFYDGGTHYLARLTPNQPGEWSYRTASTVASLDGHTGKLDVRPARLGRKGPIVIDPEAPREFRYANGQRNFPIAFECDWLFALDADNPDDIPQTRKLVDTLAEQGFDQVVMNVFAYDVKWNKDKKLKDHPEHEYGSPTAFPFAGTNEEPDHTQLNIEYFQRLDRVVEYLDERGITSHLMIYVWNKRVNWPDADSAEDNRYFDYVVKRYQAYPNLIWDISKEALGYGHDDVDYITRRIDRLRKLDAHRRLVTVHDYSYNRRFKEKVDFISVQLWQAELYHVMRRTVEQFPDQPILNIEHGGYEKSPYVVFPGSYNDPVVCLERAYKCVFAGTYPTHYWQGAAWNVLIPDPESLPPAQRPRLEYYRHMRDLADRYMTEALIAGETKSNSGFALHNNKDTFLYFVPKENIAIGLNLPKHARGKKMTGTWFNPLDGTYSEPIRKEVNAWPGFGVPADHDHFNILIVQIEPEETASTK